MRYPLNQLKHNEVSACGIASIKGYTKILETLIEAGGDINLTSVNGISPLYLAIKAN
jgi:ankyrin repeat protein